MADAAWEQVRAGDALEALARLFEEHSDSVGLWSQGWPVFPDVDEMAAGQQNPVSRTLDDELRGRAANSAIRV